MHQNQLRDRQVTTAYMGRFFTIERHQWRDGDATISREVLRHPGAVLIVPVLDDGRIVFIRNFRLATESWLLELPAGTREPDEPPETTARRELEEEAGFAAGRIRPLGEFFTTPGLTDERMHVFLAESLTPTEQRLEPWEQIRVEILTPGAARAATVCGELVDGKSIAALHLLALDREERTT